MIKILLGHKSGGQCKQKNKLYKMIKGIDGYQIYHGDNFMTYADVKSLYSTSETSIILCNYISIKKRILSFSWHERRCALHAFPPNHFYQLSLKFYHLRMNPLSLHNTLIRFSVLMPLILNDAMYFPSTKECTIISFIYSLLSHSAFMKCLVSINKDCWVNEL